MRFYRDNPAGYTGYVLAAIAALFFALGSIVLGIATDFKVNSIHPSVLVFFHCLIQALLSLLGLKIIE